MMPQSIRSQTPGGGGMPNQMNPLPNNPAAMSQMRMSGSQGQVRKIYLTSTFMSILRILVHWLIQNLRPLNEFNIFCFLMQSFIIEFFL